MTGHFQTQPAGDLCLLTEVQRLNEFTGIIEGGVTA